MKAIVLTFPMRRAREAAMRLERAAINEVVKKMVPRVPSSRLNLVVKKYMMKDLTVSAKEADDKTHSGTRPEARLSRPNKALSLATFLLVSMVKPKKRPSGIASSAPSTSSSSIREDSNNRLSSAVFDRESTSHLSLKQIVNPLLTKPQVV